MLILRFIPLIFKNVFRKKTRAILTILSTILPFIVICLMATFLHVLEIDPAKQNGMFRVIVHHKVSLANWMPEAYRAKIAQLPDARETTIFNWFGGQYIDNTPQNMFARFTVEGKTFLKVFDEYRVVDGSLDEWLGDRSGAVASVGLVKKYGWRIGQKIPLKGDLYPVNVELTLRAVVAKKPEDMALFFHREMVDEALPARKGQVMAFWVKTDSPEAVARLSRQIDALFDNTGYPTKSESEKEFINGFVSMMGNVKFLMRSLGTIIASVVLLIAANAMAMSARERVTEIATMRALGVPRGLILGLLMGEGLLLSLTGSLIALTIYVTGLDPFKRALLVTPMADFAAAMEIEPTIIGQALLISLVIGVLSSIVPAVRAARRPIPEGLRNVG